MEEKKEDKPWQFQVGNFGTCKKWETPEELQDEIDSYFKECNENKREELNHFGKAVEVSFPIPYTIEGLCEVLDCDRRTLLNYEKKKGYESYFHAIKKAKSKIQRNKIERGMTGESKTAMVIFDLKNNHDYVDKQEIGHDHKGNISHLPSKITFSKKD
jgi:hypothetical protein